jgi:hypothetical protein
MIEFIGPLYNWLQQFTNHYLTHCNILPTGHSTGTILTSNRTVSQVKVKVTLRLTVSKSWCYYCLTVTVLFLWGALSDERKGLSFEYAAGPRQRSHSRVRVPLDSRPYFTVPDLRLPFPSPPTTRRVTVEVFDPASTRVKVKVTLRLTVSQSVSLTLLNSRINSLLYLSRGPNRDHRLHGFHYCSS